MSNPVTYIRKTALGMTQAELAAALGVTQPAISQWEAAQRIPAEHQRAVRELAAAREVDWSDSWFFEVPASDGAQDGEAA